MIRFLGVGNDADVFQFTCPNENCEATGQFAVAIERNTIFVSCPEQCGQMFIRIRSALRPPQLIPLPWPMKGDTEN